MIERNSPTNWFKYECKNMPKEVLKYIQDEYEIELLEQNKNEIEFYSKQDGIGFELSINDKFTDYGTVFSKPIHTPSDLPDEIREIITVEDYFKNQKVRDLMYDIDIGVDEDYREYLLSNRIRLTTSPSKPFLNIKRANPLQFKKLKQKYDEFFFEVENSDYPSKSEIELLQQKLQDKFNIESTQVYVIGFLNNITQNSVNIHVDGVAIDITDKQLQEDVLEWCKELLNNTEELFTPAEIQLQEGYIRIWVD